MYQCPGQAPRRRKQAIEIRIRFRQPFQLLGGLLQSLVRELALLDVRLKLRMHALQGSGDIVRCIECDIVLREMLLFFTFSAGCGSGVAGFLLFDTGEEEFAFFAFGGFGVAFGLELGFAELCSGSTHMKLVL